MVFGSKGERTASRKETVVISGESRENCGRVREALEERYRVIGTPMRRLKVALRNGPVSAVVICAGRNSLGDSKRVMREVSAALGWRRVPIVLFGFEKPSAFADGALPARAGRREVVVTVEAAIARARRYTDTNPQTGLPGPNAIRRELGMRSGVERALIHFDLLALTDVNLEDGVLEGDKRVSGMGRILATEAVRHCGKRHFVGHFGGDDFFVVCERDCAVEIAERIAKRAEFAKSIGDSFVAASVIVLQPGQTDVEGALNRSFRLLEEAKVRSEEEERNFVLYEDGAMEQEARALAGEPAGEQDSEESSTGFGRSQGEGEAVGVGLSMHPAGDIER